MGQSLRLSVKGASRRGQGREIWGRGVDRAARLEFDVQPDLRGGLHLVHVDDLGTRVSDAPLLATRPLDDTLAL